MRDMNILANTYIIDKFGLKFEAKDHTCMFFVAKLSSYKLWYNYLKECRKQVRGK